jgi:putative GTP pyrophosphokinase
MKSSDQELESLEAAYRQRRETVLVKLAVNLEQHLNDCLREEKRMDRISARAKDVGRFLKKASILVNGVPKYSEPIEQIQDQIGARIVVFYKSDVDRIDALIKRYFTAIEYRKVVPDSESEFGYFGHHLILKVPSDIVDDEMPKENTPEFFELQIKTLFQHAWSEANHDLAYKPGEIDLSSEQKRLVAFTAAQAWGADHMFDKLFQDRTQG